MLPLAQIDEAIKVIDKGAASSDRWLFIALEVILLIGGTLVIKWLVNYTASKDAAHASERIELRKEITAERSEANARADRMQSEYLAVITAFKIEIAANTKAMQENTGVLVRHDLDMRNAHAIETTALVRSELARIGVSIEKLKQSPPPG